MLALPLLAALAFPPHFQWCVATAAHQIEGGNTNSDWWAFEHESGKTKDQSGEADDDWNRLAEDVQLLKDLHVNTYRFSVEWAKLEPEPGEWDENVAAHYREELQLLADAGIQPLVTLNHFTIPAWAAALGGWEWSGMPSAFEQYVGRVYRDIGPHVRDWITINEPTVLLSEGWVAGAWPPGKTDLKGIGVPAANIVRAHGLAYHKLHDLAAAAGRTVRVGLAHHLRIVQPYRAWDPLDREAASIEDSLFNWSVVDAVETGHLDLSVPFVVNFHEDIPEAKGTEDFYGINYYTRDFVKLAPLSPMLVERPVPPGAPVNDLGWEIYPEGIHDVIVQITHRHGVKPIIITENGLADAADSRRAKFLTDHLTALHQAIEEGYPVEGYCHWSLLDNFEWADGFTPRFGLYAVDYATQERTPRPSAALYSWIAAHDALPVTP